MRSPDTMLVTRMWVWNESFWPIKRTVQRRTRSLSKSVFKSLKDFLSIDDGIQMLESVCEATASAKCGTL